MKRTIVVLGLIASTGSIFFLPNKTMAESGPSNQNRITMAIRQAIFAENQAQGNYTATDEDGNQENVTTGESQTTSE
jgi:hypothetical protein